LMLYFGRVGSLWGLCAKIDSSWGEKVITPIFFLTFSNNNQHQNISTFFHFLYHINNFLLLFK